MICIYKYIAAESAVLLPSVLCWAPLGQGYQADHCTYKYITEESAVHTAKEDQFGNTTKRARDYRQYSDTEQLDWMLLTHTCSTRPFSQRVSSHYKYLQGCQAHDRTCKYKTVDAGMRVDGSLHCERATAQSGSCRTSAPRQCSRQEYWNIQTCCSAHVVHQMFTWPHMTGEELVNCGNSSLYDGIWRCTRTPPTLSSSKLITLELLLSYLFPCLSFCRPHALYEWSYQS